KALGFPIEDAVRRNQLVILNPSQRYFELVESPADVLAIIEELGDYARTAGSRRLVVDPVFTLINTSYSSHFALAITQSLVNALEDLPVTTLLLTGDGGPELNGIVRILEQNAFGVIDLSNDPETGGRMMRLTKLRYANTDHLAAHYRILDGRGLINYRGEGEQVVDVTQPWEETGATSRKVLILGARPETIRRVREALGDSYEVEAEADLKAGVERVKRDRPGLVLVTPSRNAGAIGAILDLAQNASSSIAFLSPTANRQSDKVLYLRAGADDFITEPFTPAEFRARTEALVRRSGRRLKMRDSTLASITPEQLNSLMNAGEGEHRQKGPAILSTDNQLSFEPEFQDRLHRNLEIVSKFEQPFALYWMKGQENDAELGRDLAKLCRQEDVVCHNRRGEFVAILTATDQHGLRGFENRLRERLGDRLDRPGIRRGHVLHEPGQPLDEIAARAFQN
ncbi:MAG TPA: ATPase domain-containing protein, partial [Thermoanaerobaculia bacterium]|nr:ATPase domain-containing protein [Thermoanaerobaculia bacterium]